MFHNHLEIDFAVVPGEAHGFNKHSPLLVKSVDFDGILEVLEVLPLHGYYYWTMEIG